MARCSILIGLLLSACSTDIVGPSDFGDDPALDGKGDLFDQLQYQPVPLGEQRQVRIPYGTSQFVFRVRETATVRVTVDPITPNIDSQFELRDASREFRRRINDRGVGASELVEQRLAPGRYGIQVSTYGLSGSRERELTMKLECVEGAGCMRIGCAQLDAEVRETSRGFAADRALLESHDRGDYLEDALLCCDEDASYYWCRELRGDLAMSVEPVETPATLADAGFPAQKLSLSVLPGYDQLYGPQLTRIMDRVRELYGQECDGLGHGFESGLQPSDLDTFRAYLATGADFATTIDDARREAFDRWLDDLRALHEPDDVGPLLYVYSARLPDRICGASAAGSIHLLYEPLLHEVLYVYVLEGAD